MALVLVLLDERQTGESIALAEDLLERHPANVLARLHLARGLTRRARYADAISTLETVRELSPDNPLFRYYLGHAHYRAQKDLESGQVGSRAVRAARAFEELEGSRSRTTRRRASAASRAARGPRGLD